MNNIYYVDSVVIQNMRKFEVRTFRFKPHCVNYLVGSNGCGKSTVLNAIQLALLGYIPGKKKRNMDIFKNASNNPMRISLTLKSQSGSMIVINRTYTKHGSRVTSEVEAIPEVDIDNIMGNVELPIIDFKDFMNMSPNEIKKWMISKFANDSMDLNLRDEMKKSIENIGAYDMSYLMDEILKSHRKKNGDKVNIDTLKQLNDDIKQRISAQKIKVDTNEKTLRSLVQYGDVVRSVSEFDEEIHKQENLLKHADNYKITQNNLNRYKQKLDAISDGLEESIDTDELYLDTCNEIKRLTSNVEYEEEYINSNIDTVLNMQHKIKELERILSSNGNCPYTGKSCNEILHMINCSDDEISKLKEKIEFIDIDSHRNRKVQLEHMISGLKQKQVEILKKYDERKHLKDIISQLDIHDEEMSSIPDIDFYMENLEMEIRSLKEERDKAVKNEAYNVMFESCNKEMLKLQLEMSALKSWEECTGTNGLQSRFMMNQINDIKNQINDYFKQYTMFGTFEIVDTGISNAFTFGIRRDDTFIEYAQLSSGEKCKFMLGFISCICANSNSDIKCIMIDDALDHLDKINVYDVLSAMSNFNLQYIFAGVVENSIIDTKDDDINNRINFINLSENYMEES